MNKEEILKMSREENEGRHDEREMIAFGTASRVGMLVGALVCVLLVLASEFLFHIPEIGWVGWLVYFAMQGSSNIVLYKDSKIRKNLVWGIIELAFAIAFVVVLVVKSVVWYMNDKLILKNNLKASRSEKGLSQQQLADMVGVSRNTISSIETGQFNPTAKLALILCIALDKEFEELFYF